MRYCENCGHEIEGDNAYCENCGNFVGIKYCQGCGAALSLRDNFCPSCSMRQEAETIPEKAEVKSDYKKHIIPLMVWSLILVALVNPVGTPLSAASALYLLSANSDDDDEQSDLKKKKSLILCIAATAIDIATLIVLLTVFISKYIQK